MWYETFRRSKKNGYAKIRKRKYEDWINKFYKKLVDGYSCPFEASINPGIKSLKC